MGLLGEILALPLAPVRGTGWVIDQLLLTAEREYYDPAPVLEELAQLEQELLDGTVSEEEFDRREDELLDKMARLEEHQRRLRARS
ncbi:gas vesicle protein GvpG [Streptomyces sp. N2-109]|uniref:Gas vesicle protein GvpG n=1 Tax=Streptomyces gossypii TaxID=2883101 RepID=A0ABT2JMZ9_9ACTN|nr:gas vesicle protein GvpG [Streptomyces gossypii]MCT2588639.1 gas vesicle protein GvpG [Streptomyces gossypii]